MGTILSGTSHISNTAHVYPFTPPCTKPLTMYRCRNKNRAMTGTAAKTAPAEKMPQFFERVSATKEYSPTARVCESGSVSTTEAITNSLEMLMKDSSATTAKMG